MKRRLTFFLFFISIYISSLFAQVPNGDFEQWESGEPANWWTSNILVQCITNSTDSHSGQYAARGEALTAINTTVLPLLVLGEIEQLGLPVTQRYNTLSGYYKLLPVNDENLTVTVGMFKDGVPVGSGGAQFNAASAYTLFSVPIYYSNEEIPNSCQISMTVGDNTADVDVGSVFFVDDLFYQNVTDVADNVDGITTYSLSQNYPNPFNPTTIIKYSLPVGVGTLHATSVQLKVYNMLGQVVATLVNEQQPAGNYEVKFDASGLPSGIYYYRIQSGDFQSTKKMILLR